MKGQGASIAKITHPDIAGVFPHKRLFRLLDEGMKQPVTWISAPAGSGKTTLVASYLDERKLPCLWYQVDRSDDDAATFFYYMGLAAKKAAPRYKRPLPLLTPEYLLGLPTFTLRYFEKLYERVQGNKNSRGQGGKGSRVRVGQGFSLADKSKPKGLPYSYAKKTTHNRQSSIVNRQSFLLVLDNYQEAPASSMLHEIIRGGMEIIPQGIKVIAISRSAPPDVFARMRANDRMGTIDFDELRLTEEETAGVMRLRVKGAFNKDCVRKAHGMTQGWAAGLTLLLESVKKGEADFKSFEDSPLEGIFDYFASEIFRKAEPETQMFLLKTSLLPDMDLQMTERLTGSGDAGKILSGLTRRNFFIERRKRTNPVYRYHPLFREFLHSRVKNFLTKEDITDLRREAAAILEEAGRVEDAFELYKSACDWEGAVRLIMANAMKLVQEGRHATLDAWLTIIPDEVKNDNPWLLYWLGVCRMPFKPHDSKEYLEKAFQDFRLRKDTLGIFLSWVGIIDFIFCDLGNSRMFDKWITVLDEIRCEHSSFPSMEVEALVTGGILLALSSRQPDHPKYDEWLRGGNSLLPKLHATQLKLKLLTYMAICSTWRGNLSDCKYQLKLMNDTVELMDRSGEVANSFVLISLKHIESNYLWHSGEHEAALKRVAEALEIADATGMHVQDFVLFGEAVSASLCTGDFDLAQKYLNKMAFVIGTDRNFDISYFHHQNAWYFFLRGDYKEALMHAELGLEHGIASGHIIPDYCGHLAMINISFKTGEHQKALELLDHVKQVARRANFKTGEFMVLITEAYIALEMGIEKKCIEILRKAFPVAREVPLMHFLFWIPSVMSKLCAKALENGIETEYVKSLIKKRGMIPDDPNVYVESWPYPVKIYTFGRFGLFRDEKPVTSSGKIQKKPLEMLKALLALGGKKVREEQLTDLLWPEAEGDAAHSAFKMTLSRLRQLSGNENIVQIQEGRITLDSRYCWVDAWAFERLVNETEGLVGQGFSLAKSNPKGSPYNIADILCLTYKAISIYKGHFLTEDIDRLWTLSMREKLRGKFIQLISKTGRFCEQAGQFDKAVDYYRKGLEVDNLSEEFCQCLMKCYQKLGRKAEAVSLFKWCAKTLDAVLGIVPSAKTEAVYRGLKE